MEKYCKSCGSIFNDLKFKLCPYCGEELDTRYGRQPIPRKLRHEVFKRDGYRCRECGASKDETSLEIDHIVPVARGGTNDIDNLQTLCRECNRMKHTDTWVGGETDLESLKNKLSHLENQLDEYEEKIEDASNEEEQIEYKYQITILNEDIDQLKEEIKNEIERIERAERNKIQENNDAKRKDMLYKKLYVELSDDDLITIIEALKKKDMWNIVFQEYSGKGIQTRILEQKEQNLYTYLIKIDELDSLIKDKHYFIKKLVDNFSEEEIQDLLKFEELLELKVNQVISMFGEDKILLLKNKRFVTQDIPKDIVLLFLKKFDVKIMSKMIKDERRKIEEKKREEERMRKKYAFLYE